MPFSMYDASVPVFRESLQHASAILVKAEQHAAQHAIQPEVLINGRLFPDMHPLKQQARGIATLSMLVSSKLADDAPPFQPISAEGSDVTFDAMRGWMHVALDYLGNLEPSQFVRSADKEVTFPLRNVPCKFTGKSYLLRFGLPNFFFHCTVLYSILRHLSVPLGKSDFVLPEFDGTAMTFA